MKTIIHFTSEFESIQKILTSSSLGLRYCKEEFRLGDEVVSDAVHPMVCFSEYYVPRIDTKIITYGLYGIGFRRKWVNVNKIHPVLYIDKNSLLAQSLTDLLKARRIKDNADQLPSNVRLSIMNIKCFTKNAVGYNSHFKIDDFDFKNEFEWRYVPEKSNINNNYISESRSTYLKNKKKYDQNLEPFPLKFTIEDIKYIFVAKESEKNEIAEKYSIEKDKIRISRWETEPKQIEKKGSR
jgi:Putative abortive phage resistance protein AbiGi, antitoxin